MLKAEKKARITAILTLFLLLASVSLMTNVAVDAQLSTTQPTVSIPTGVTPNATATV